jgi:hypothetical protein
MLRRTISGRDIQESRDHRLSDGETVDRRADSAQDERHEGTIAAASQQIKGTR